MSSTTVTGQLADAIGDFACLVFVLFAASARPRVVQSATCPVRELTSPRDVQSASWQSASWRIRELSSYPHHTATCVTVHQHRRRYTADRVTVNYYFVPCRCSKYCDEMSVSGCLFVCLFVCLSARKSKNYNSKLHKIYLTCYPGPWLGPAMTIIECVM